MKSGFPFHSIRWRIQVWHAVILLVAIIAFCITAYRLAWIHQLRRVDRVVVERERALISHLIHTGRKVLSDEGSGSRPPHVTLDLLLERGVDLSEGLSDVFGGQDTGHSFFMFLDPAGAVRMRSPNAPMSMLLPDVGESGMVELSRISGSYRESVRRSPSGVWSVVGRDISGEIEEMRHFALSLTASGFALWLVGLTGGWWIAGRVIRPIQTIGRTASRIAADNLRERIEVAGTGNELDQLSGVLNQTFDRLQAAFERQKQFTADASHELRNPIAVVVAETQRILRRDHSVSECREALQVCQDAALRMKNLTEALLVLARQDDQERTPVRETVDLDAVVNASVARLCKDAEQAGIRIELNGIPITFSGDPVGIGMVVDNLVVNAIHHHSGGSGGTVRVSWNPDGEGVQVAVEDDGPGIPEADAPHIFDRFYRADKSRSHSSGHFGLGLAVAKSIVENHGGTLDFSNNPDRGVTFRMRLPR